MINGIKNIKDVVEKAIKNIRTALMGNITSVLKSNNTIYIRASDEEELRDIKIVTPYGYFSLPTNGINAQVLFNGNSSKNVSVIGVENKPPIPIEIGEVIIFYNENSYILIKEGRAHIQGDLYVNGNIRYSGDIAKG